ncbi:MAG: chaperone protein DnaJ 1 [Candidatus Hydrogenedentota bacterium]
MATVQQNDLYEILGISKDAPQEEIRRAYLKLAKQYHPDKTGGDKEAEDKLKEINAAYDTLKSPEKRKKYDEEREARSAFGGFGSGGFSGNYQDFSGAGGFGGFEDLFSTMFGQGGAHATRRPAVRPGNDLEMAVQVDLHDVANGAKKTLRFKRWDRCTECNGSGAEPGTQPQTCPDCHGSGMVTHTKGAFSMSRTCPKCQGQGTFIGVPCKTCAGRGRQKTDRTVQVTIPQGVETGTRLRVPREGEAGDPGAPNGDLYVHIDVRKHELFERDGADLICEVPISFPQATLGATVLVPTLTGKANLTVPEGTQSGAMLRMKGLGLPRLGGGGKGDQYIRINVEVPKRLNGEQREIIEKLYGIDNPEGYPQRRKFEELVSRYASTILWAAGLGALATWLA